ncbi:MAG: MFS family permease [Oceanicoccus sp.]
MEKALQKNIINIYLMAFFQNAMVVTAVFVPLIQRHGLSMAEVLQTQALFALVIAIFEVPSGYLADLWGRKNTIVIGAVFCIIAFFMLVIADSFVDFLIYEALIAIGISLNSGADLALLYDSQSELNRSEQKNVHSDNNLQISRLISIEGYAGGFAAILAGILSFWSLDWVLWAQAMISVGALLFALALIEAPRTISNQCHRENWQKVIANIWQDRLVLWTAVAIIAFSLSALNVFWLYQKYWQLQAIPLHWFGYIWAMHCFLRAISAHYANQLESLLGPRRLFMLVILLPLLGFLGMGLLDSWTGLLLGLAFPLSSGLSLVVLYGALNRRVTAAFRATINSLVSLGIRVVFIVTGPLLGWLVDYRGVQFSVLLLGMIFIPLFCLLLWQLNRKINQQQQATVALQG